jgi:glycosyltransferase involved in cell wall biosynthesis
MKNTIVVNARFLTQNVTGVQRFAIEISKQLKLIYTDQIIFVSPKNVLNSELAKELGVIIVGGNKGHLWEQLDLPKYLRKNGNPLLLNLANMAPIWYHNKISTIHDVAFLTFPNTFSKQFVLLYKFIIPKIIRNSVQIITVSEFSKTEIIKFYNIAENKISVIYNAVDDSFEYKEDLVLSLSDYFVAVSSLNHRKNLLRTLESFVFFNENNPSVSLCVIGDLKNDAFKEINFQKYKDNLNIKFCGRLSDEELIRYYSNATGFIYPSLYEGFGLPPLEAQACECPVIISDVTSLPEIFLDSALYCSPYSVSSMTEAFEKIFYDKNLRKDLRAKGKNNIKRFSWEKSATDLCKIIDIKLIPSDLISSIN